MANMKLNYKWILILIALAVIFIRIPALNSRTIHIDEGMGIRASEHVLANEWQYSPHNGHGATLFYAGAVIRSFVGTNVVAFRVFTALCMLAAISLLWFFYRKKLSIAGQIALIAGLGFSSGLLFFGNYFIHEALFILFTVTTFLCFEKWLQAKKGIWLGATVIFLALMYMTKETALLTYGVWFFAGLIILVFKKPKNSVVASPATAGRGNLGSGLLRRLLGSLPAGRQARNDDRVNLKESLFFIIAGLAVSGILYVFFFGTNLDLIKAPYYWIAERATSMHLQPFHYYLTLLFFHEFFLLFSAVTLSIILFFKKLWNSRLAFFFLWFLFMLIAYSLIPYKTPWLIPNMILPLGLFVTFALNKLWQTFDNRLFKNIVVFIAILLLAVSLTRLYLDNFAHPDRSKKYDYAYLQSGKGLKEFTNTLKGLSAIYPRKTLPLQIIGRGDELLHVLTEEYDRIYPPFKADMPVYINYMHSANETKRLLTSTGSEYIFLKFTYITPLPEIDIFVRKDIFEAYQQSSFFINPQSYWSNGTIRYN